MFFFLFFLIILFLLLFAVSNPSFLNVILETLCCCINAVLNVDESSFFFFFMKNIIGRYHLSNVVTYLITTNFHFIVLFKNSTEYLTKRSTQMFIPLIRFLLQSLASSSFVVLLSYFFLISSFIFLCLIMCAFTIPSYL